jgi:succinate dehydrogenase/fumarate reductase flavoprotein subunit
MSKKVITRAWKVLEADQEEHASPRGSCRSSPSRLCLSGSLKRADEPQHRLLAAQSVTRHTLFREETRWRAHSSRHG